MDTYQRDILIGVHQLTGCTGSGESGRLTGHGSRRFWYGAARARAGCRSTGLGVGGERGFGRVCGGGRGAQGLHVSTPCSRPRLLSLWGGFGTMSGTDSDFNDCLMTRGTKSDNLKGRNTCTGQHLICTPNTCSVRQPQKHYFMHHLLTVLWSVAEKMTYKKTKREQKRGLYRNLHVHLHSSWLLVKLLRGQNLHSLNHELFLNSADFHCIRTLTCSSNTQTSKCTKSNSVSQIKTSLSDKHRHYWSA